MIGLDRMLLRNMLVSMIFDGVVEAIAKNNEQIERDFAKPETNQHCCT